MSMFSAKDVRTITYVLDGDPGADNKQLHWFRAPRDITIDSAWIVAANTQNAGTAVVLQIEDWGTAGTAVAGTIGAALGGTATTAVLTAKTPAAFTINTARNYLPVGTWVVIDYQEEGAGWISGDRFVISMNYTIGKGNTSE